jgi:hypothetical protein
LGRVVVVVVVVWAFFFFGIFEGRWGGGCDGVMEEGCHVRGWMLKKEFFFLAGRNLRLS